MKSRLIFRHLYKNGKILNLNKTMLTIFLLSSFQVFSAVCIILYDCMNKNGFIAKGDLYGETFLVVIVGAVLLNSFFAVRDARSIGKNAEENETLKASIAQVEKLNITLRGQRHDFMNHLQVVYGLMDMEEYPSAKDYIEKVFNDIQKVNKVLKTSNPAVNALLQAKLIYCEKRNIRFDFYITTRLAELKVPSWEFCRILGNIIDNSIYALMEVQNERKIELHLFEDIKNYGFRIKNNGPAIPRNVIDKIFEAGYTTKGEHGDGMGLAISKEILEEHGGSISVTSNDEETVFEGCISKQ